MRVGVTQGFAGSEDALEQAAVPEALEEPGIGPPPDQMIGTVRSPHHVFVRRSPKLVSAPTELVPLSTAHSLVSAGRGQGLRNPCHLLHILVS